MVCQWLFTYIAINNNNIIIRRLITVEKMVLSLDNKEVRMTSMDLVDMINEFREIEAEKTKKPRAVLQHKSFITKIDKELELLEGFGFSGRQNILPSSYMNRQNKKQPCYSLNRDGALQMLNSESALVRMKTVEYINELEKQNVMLESDNKELHSIATSDKELAKRKYEADKITYKLHNAKKIISESTYSNLEENIEKIIDVQFYLKAQDRYRPDWELSKAQYKNKVRKYISDRLENEIEVTRDSLKVAVATKINTELHKGIIETSNRSFGKILAHREKSIEERDRDIAIMDVMLENNSTSGYTYPSDNEFVCVDCHSFTHNYMYEQKFGRTTRSDSYNAWIYHFPKDQVPDMDYWEVDWDKPVEMFINYSAKAEMDIRNLDKAIIDMIIGRIYGLDDNIVDSVSSRRVATVDNYQDGKISFFIRNI